MEAPALAALLAWGALKGALLLAAAGLVNAALRNASASARHAVWSLALGAALVLPALGALAPAWRVALLPAPVGAGAAAAVATTGGWAAPLLVGVWLFGLVVVSVRWGASAVVARRLVTRARPLAHDGWRRDADRIGSEIGLAYGVELRESAVLRSPVAWGLRRPVLLLPAGADEWTPERREAVLAHELSHVRRRDCLTGAVAEAACALHWFNPLAWLAYRRLHVERERACDDGVLRGGLRASRYASHLLSVARDAGASGPRAPQLVPAMARRSEIEERVRAMLDDRPRREPLSSGAVSILAVVALAAATALGALEPVRRPAVPAPAAPAALPGLAPLAGAPPAPGAPTAPTEADTAPRAPETPAPLPRAPRRPPATPSTPRTPRPPAPLAVDAPAPPSTHASASAAGSRSGASARVLTWRAPSGPMASDEPRRVARVVRVGDGDAVQHFVFVLPDLPAAVWRERSDEVWAIMERSIARQAYAAATASRASPAVRMDRFVVAVRRRHDGAGVDSAAGAGYRGGRDEEVARTKAGT